MAAERDGQYTRAKTLATKVTDTTLLGYAQAFHFLSASQQSVKIQDLTAWLEANRETAIADHCRLMSH